MKSKYVEVTNKIHFSSKINIKLILFTETFITQTMDMKDFCSKSKRRMLVITKHGNKEHLLHHIGKNPALKMYKQFSLNTY